ncbi:MAG: hypothetical protein HC840_20720 [Leptolyngbyaceae cyanobacterium RM2_2_4]|nr:hypothetical protein [Leptolyngbyaceae cyanobacterium SM1_4_3]NJN01876.1 hypothetical protein [Leptolyngbyaceae cyanobacterium RM1_1_2]NJO51459.1 hypothetical protein [Leptolyngbyaceae cyanobacterium RM2_2_4]
MKLPTKDEINVYNSLDEITACNHFLNKTLAEAEVLFRESSLAYGQDLMWMGFRAFAFYLQAAINYLKSDYSEGDSDIINCLYSTLEYRWEEEDFLSLHNTINELINYVMNNYDKFEVDTDIYSDFLEKYRQLLNKLETARSDCLESQGE